MPHLYAKPATHIAKPLSLALIACIAAALALGAFGCSSDNRQRAAEFGDTVIYEQDVTDYTDNFRKTNGYETDTSWSLYLGEQELTGSTWREEAIRNIAAKLLVEQRAEELGITADEDTVSASIESLKQSNSITDDESWQAYLDQNETTEEELRDSYSFSSIEQQVVSADTDISTNVTSDMVDSYVKENLGDIVTRKFSVISFAADDKSAAKSALKELSKLSGGELEERFEEYVDKQKEACPDQNQGNIGWDIAYDLSDLVDGDDKIKLQPGDLYQKLAKGSKCLQIYLCTGRTVFNKKFSYDSCKDDDLKATLKTSTLSSSWSDILSDYLTNLVEQADVNVYQMPSGLSYDLTPYTNYEDAANAYNK